MSKNNNNLLLSARSIGVGMLISVEIGPESEYLSARLAQRETHLVSPVVRATDPTCDFGGKKNHYTTFRSGKTVN